MNTHTCSALLFLFGLASLTTDRGEAQSTPEVSSPVSAEPLYPTSRAELRIQQTEALGTGMTGLPPPPDAPYRNAKLEVEERVQDLLRRMTLSEKIGQMTQVDRAVMASHPEDIRLDGLGSLLSGGGGAPYDNTPQGWADMVDGFQQYALQTRLGIPLLYGADAVHGHNNVRGAVLYPHNIGLGASRDPDLVKRIGQATAEEMAATGVRWTFSPCLCVVRDIRWGRSYESFGEDPALVSSLASIIEGYQGQPGEPVKVLATAKHYLGDGGTAFRSSTTYDYLLDQGDTRVTEAELRRVHLPPFQAAVLKGVGSVMASYSSWNGTRLHAQKYLLTDVLKKELNFQGFVVSDWQAVDQIPGGYNVAVRSAINAGVDMVMVPWNYPYFLQTLTAEVESGLVPTSRIDDAVVRILRQKFRLGLFEHPLADRTSAVSFGGSAHRALAREAVQKSLVLLKNEGNVLPLKKGGRLLVAGSSADDVGRQSGGWSLSWQGQSGPVFGGTSILSGLQRLNGQQPGASVTYVKDPQPGQARGYAAGVVVVGEEPYAEGRGDSNDLNLSAADRSAVENVCSSVPCVVVTVSGRPLLMSGLQMNALVAAWLPGTEGQGVADVLFGDVNFSGTLPVSWPRSMDQLPLNIDSAGYDPLFRYGYGLNYH